MATQVQNRRGSTAEHSTFTGAVGELTVDTTKDTVVVHDGAVAGGRPLLREDQSNLPTSAPTTGIYNASGSLAISTGGSGRLFVDSNGGVGIGNNAPSGTGLINGLVVGNGTDNKGITLFGASTTQQNIAFTDTAQTQQGLIQYDHSSDYMRFFTASSERLRITSAGLVGVGTSAPGAELDVRGLGRFYANSSGLSLDNIGRSADNISIIRFLNNTVSTELGRVAHYGNDLDVRNLTANSLTFGTNNTERARIDSSGRLLVGTSSSVTTVFDSPRNQTFVGDQGAASFIRGSVNEFGPNVHLVKSRNTSSGSRTIVQSGDELGTIWFAGDDGSTLNSVGAFIRAQVDGTPGANNMPGRIVLSTTAAGASSPTERMRITQAGVHAMFAATDALSIHSAAASGASTAMIQCRHSATGVFSGTASFFVYTNGNVLNTNNSYGAISDIKLKENIVDANSQWSDIKALQVRNYNFKEGQTHTQIGLVAQEVELVSPGLVTESPDHDEEGNDLGTVTKSVNYSVLYMKAVKALQEAMERIETLEAKVAALESA